MNFDKEIEEYVNEMTKEYTEELCRMIKIPSVSNDKTKKEELYNILREVERIVKPIGFESEIIETRGGPALIATLKSREEAPWLWIYNHMDVQPAKEPEWKTQPFEPAVEEGRIIGRGSTDDKGPALAVIHAIKFLKSKGLELPNIQLVYETEEEVGSTNFGQFLEENLRSGKLREPRSILVSDTIFSGEWPTISYKLRGVTRAFAKLELAEKEVHSGMAGGAAINPLKVMINALNTCYEGNEVTIPGWKEGVKETSEKELESTKKAAQTINIDTFKKELGLREMSVREEYELLKKLWHEPTFEIHGFEGVQYEPGSIKTAIPRSVTAKITMRTVPGQEVRKLLILLEEHLKKTHEKITVEGDGLPACMTNIENPFIERAQEACKYGFEKEALFVGCGGSIGAVSEMQRIIPQAPVILISQSLLSDGYHAPNEEFRIEQAQKGCKVMAKYISSIAKE
jgi:acetylornithine deacetylase/succinyl-diaminopimelate desuccinylase-like protein